MKRGKIILFHFTAGCLLGLSCTDGSRSSEFVQLTDLEGDEQQIDFSTDGSQMAFISDNRGNADVYVLEIETGSLRHIDLPASNESYPNWSPDGMWLSYTVSTDTGSLIHLHHLVEEEIVKIQQEGVRSFRPRWSPDGTEVAFIGDDARSLDIYIYSRNSGEMSRLTDEPGSEYLFGFSPDGRYLGYNKRGGASEDLFAVSRDGEELINISKHAGHEWYPLWSPNGDRVLFYSTWGDEMTEIWTADFPTGALTQISDHLAEDFGGVWSPDGNSVIYISKRDGVNDLYLYKFDDKQTRRLNFSHRLKRGWPIWSPDGKSIAFSTNMEEEYLYRMDLETMESRRITDGVVGEEFPSVSRDGKYIAFVSAGQGSEANVMLFDRTTREISPFLDTYHYQTRPLFANQSMDLGVLQGSGGSITTNNVYSISLDKNDSVQLTGIGGVRHFIWSYNDEEIIYAYDSSANYTFDIWRLNLVTGNNEVLLKTPHSELASSASPDGSDFLFHSDRDGKMKIYRMSLKNSDQGTITELHPGWDGRYSPDGNRIVFLSEENPERTVDLFMMRGDGTNIQRLTNDRFDEFSPVFDTDGKSVIYSVQKGSADIWLYYLPEMD